MSEVPRLQCMAANAGGDYLEKRISMYNSCPSRIRLTKICATIGPTSRDPETLEKLFEKGINVARVNLLRGMRVYHSHTLQIVRLALESYCKKIGRQYPLAIGISTKGPSILTGMLTGGPLSEVDLEKGETVKLTVDEAYMGECTSQIIFVNYPNFTKVVKKGHRIYIDDGIILLSCISVQEEFVTCQVVYGGRLSSYRTVNLPDVVNIDFPSVSDEDKEDIKFAVDNDIDIIFASFIRSAKCIADIRALLGKKGNRIMLIAKVENQQGLINLDEIMQAADGILIARIDLGTEIPMEKLFIAQKNISARCNLNGKPVVCAAQFLISMVKNKRPTTAECTDIANAIFDGSDCLSLSTETSHGDNPVEVVEVMSNICREAEGAMWHKKFFTDVLCQVKAPIDATHCIAISAIRAAIHSSAAAIVLLTTTGRTARLVSKYHPACPIIAVSRDLQVVRHCLIYRAIFPIYFENERLDDWSKDVECRITYGINYGKQVGIIRFGDPVVVLCGWRKGAGLTNTLKVINISDFVCEQLL